MADEAAPIRPTLYDLCAGSGELWYVSDMTKIQAQIIELFRTLEPAEQREIAEQLYETTVAGPFYDRMTPEQRAELDEGIAQAERGQVLPADEAFDRLAKRFGFSAE